MATEWTASDANSDGKLDLEEFRTFVGMRNAYMQSKGMWWNPDNQTEPMYALYNRQSEGEGITMLDFKKSMGIWVAKFGACKAAATQ